MDGIVLLKEDHKAVKRLFREFEKTQGQRDAGGEARARRTDHRGADDARVHRGDDLLPGRAAGAPDTTDHVLESVEEHHVVAWLLSELTKLDPADETFDAKVTVLIENVEHHVEEEEKEWFPEVRKALGRNRLVETR